VLNEHRRSSFLLPLWGLGTQAGQHPGRERQKFLKRLEMRGLPGHHVLDSPHKSALRGIRPHVKLHHKRALYR
jgi:hypothetical protein